MTANKCPEYMRQYWWKILSIVLLLYTVIAGFLIPVPEIGNLYETIRNLFFHVPMWFSQLVLITVSLVYSILFLRKPRPEYDFYATEFARTGTLLGCLGLITGAIWANYTWGVPWNNDPKQLGAAIALLIYLAYFVLRNSMTDLDKRGRIAAVYNIFAYFIYVPMIMVLPRLVESLHPGGKGVEGNPGLGGGDLDPTMRVVFWPAVLGWTLLGVWISTLRYRLKLLEEQKHFQ
ncbi:MAG: cytochrome c biogenesis protein CcsA [Candidatus Pseudobacter hemicellulosilyticus]|uniref:Cytochrome c biogenesis protein CcsA n=1 Tax=Candidatus Pseudobacter hemicellulosilyticus TaxID=3121375 RepID=A0AAJ5WRK3_9BACT|nr:MAG: cytochrome c biogenesis protein CcsA [Pseudobacter sp.]